MGLAVFQELLLASFGLMPFVATEPILAWLCPVAAHRQMAASGFFDHLRAKMIWRPPSTGFNANLLPGQRKEFVLGLSEKRTKDQRSSQDWISGRCGKLSSLPAAREQGQSEY